jgi:hypothetical protein
MICSRRLAGSLPINSSTGVGLSGFRMVTIGLSVRSI